MLHKLKLDGNIIKVNYLRRLPRSRGERVGEPLKMRVELSYLGDKIRIFTQVEEVIKKKEDFDYQITNKIPRYALNSYKFLCKVASEVRHQNTNLKTRVGIMRGDPYPTITVRKRTEKDYKKIDENTFERAKAEVVRRAKLEAERKKKEKEDQLLSDEPMDTQQAADKIGNLKGFLINLFFPHTHRKPRFGNRSRHIRTSN